MAMACSSDSGKSFNWFRPVTALREQDNAEKENSKMVTIIRVIGIFFNNSMNVPTKYNEAVKLKLTVNYSQ